MSRSGVSRSSKLHSGRKGSSGELGSTGLLTSPHIGVINRGSDEGGFYGSGKAAEGQGRGKKASADASPLLINHYSNPARTLSGSLYAPSLLDAQVGKRKMHGDEFAFERVKPQSQAWTLVLLVLLGWVLVAGSLTVGIILIGHKGHTGNFDWPAFTGVWIIILFVPYGVFNIGQMLLVVSKYTKISPAQRVAVYILSGVLCTLGIAAAWALLLKPGASLGVDEYWQGDELQIVWGGFILVVFFPLAIFCFAGARKLMKQEHELFLGEKALLLGTSRPPLHPLTPNRFLDNHWTITGLCLWYAFILVNTFWLSPVWNFSYHSYISFPSPYSLAPQTEGASFNLKIYSDVLVYWGFMYGIILIGSLAHFVPKIRAFFHKRVRIGKPGPWNPFAVGASVGELLLLLAFCGLYAYWWCYWYLMYERIHTESTTLGQKVARACGHMANLSMSFLLLPLTRNSCFEAIFGVPFERAIKYHRWMGAFYYLNLTAHMLTWLVSWGIDGLLANNIVTINSLQVGPQPPDNVPDLAHVDNWTIFMVELSWVLLTGMVLIAVFFRRSSYRLFYFTHMFAVVHFVTALLHAWTLWYYVAPGLTLWMFDRFVRLSRGIRSTRVISVEHSCGGITRLEFEGSLFPQHYAGQFAYVNVPAISWYRWHPFTISSSPCSSRLTFHIKDMGSDTFTRRLAKFAHSASEALLAGHSVNINLDGPYGRPVDYSTSDVLILVAGGIGVTPMHAIFKDVYDRASLATSHLTGSSSSTKGDRDLLFPSFKKVLLIWTVRSSAMAMAFADTVKAVHDHNPNNTFEIMLHCTSVDGESKLETFSGISPSAVDFVQDNMFEGRPNLEAVFNDVAKQFSGHSIYAGVCGPETLIHTVSELSFKHNFTFHSETFHF